MKSIFIAFDQAYYERIVELLRHNGSRGFTAWQDVQGRGTTDGEPHFGSHAWPSMACAIMSIVSDEKVDKILEDLHALDVATPKLGLRAFVWNVEKSI